MPSAATVLPPRNGRIWRHRSAEYCAGSISAKHAAASRTAIAILIGLGSVYGGRSGYDSDRRCILPVETARAAIRTEKGQAEVIDDTTGPGTRTPRLRRQRSIQ